MKILMISKDPSVLVSGSSARERMERYAEELGELYIVVLGGGNYSVSGADHIRIYSANGNVLTGLIRACAIAIRLARRISFGVVTVQTPDEAGLIAWIAARISGVPLQMQIHADILSPWYRNGSWKDWVRYWIARFLIPRADCMRVVSERIRQSIVASGIKHSAFKIIVLPIFTDVSKFLHAEADPATEERLRAYDFKMIAVGRFVDKEKNFSMLIDVMRLFVRICPQALLVIAGTGPDRRKYELGIRNYGLEKNIILEPWRDDLERFYKSFDLFLLSSNYEGWGRVVIEAMAAGLPPVMTDVGLAGEIVKNGENGIVVPVRDSDAFLQAMKILYQDKKKRIRLATTGRQTARNLKPETLQDYLESYKNSFLVCKRNLEKKRLL